MKKLFLNNLGLKVTSLILAVIMWFLTSAELTAKGEAQRKVVNNIEIGVLTSSKEEIFEPFKIKMAPQEVSLYIEGPKDQIKNTNSEDIIAFIDISDFAKEGIYSLPVRCILPDNIKMLSKTPICRVELLRYEEVGQ